MKITVYHGSDHVVEKPLYGYGKTTNDFGKGFYLTEHFELAKEWAAKKPNTKGFVSKYELNTEWLRILDLTSNNYSILNWISILLKFRVFNLKYDVSKIARKFLIDNYSIDIESYDVIIGYRADDSYYDYTEAFLNNIITIEQLEKIMNLGNLGKQIVLKSQYSFMNLKYVGYDVVDSNIYYHKSNERLIKANKDFMKIQIESSSINGKRIIDIMKGNI